MSSQVFALPVDVPWKLVAASPDMMDTKFCEKGFPPAWRSSLAISAYEPSPDELPTQLCDQKITYLKVTCSITGYQPTQEETAQLAPPPLQSSSNPTPATLSFPNVPGGPPIDNAAVFGDFVDAYFACYGVLLNVAVFPSTTTVPDPTVNVPVSTTNFGPKSSISNPSTSGEVMFTSSRRLANLAVRKLPGKASYGVQINKSLLQIDLPLSRNVSLTIGTSKSNSGTVTAYLGTQAVFTAPLSTKAGVAVVDIKTGMPITRILIDSKDPATYLKTVTYSSTERPTTLADYPHIVDFEPKTRDLYQAATDQSELLTGSNSDVGTGKSMSNTSSSEMGLSLSGGYGSGQGAGPNVQGQITGKWGNTATDSSSTQVDQSRERRETQGTTTNITQQYNLLTGYHSGTNRAAFLMLPRPHTLQATDYRTFVRGLRMIEGIQEFFLIISRPKVLPGICIEASLETAHFPEDVSTQPPPTPVGPKQTFSFQQAAHAEGHFTTSTEQTPFNFSLPAPWVIDTTVTTPPQSYTAIPGLAGVFYHAQPISGQNPGSDEWDQAISTFSLGINSSNDNSVTGYIAISAAGWPSETNADIQVLFTVFAVQAPTVPVDQEQVVVSDFLVTSRELCVCLNSCPTDNCVMIVPPRQVPYSQSPVLGVGSPTNNQTATNASQPAGAVSMVTGVKSAVPASTGKLTTPVATPSITAPAAATGIPGSAPVFGGAASATPRDKHGVSTRSSIVYETKLKVPRAVLRPDQLQKSRTPAARELMYKIQHHLLNSWRLPGRRPPGTAGFLESDYLCDRLRKRLPQRYLSRRISEIKGLPREVVRNLGARATIGDALKLDLHRLGVIAKVGIEQAVLIRRSLLGFAPVENFDAEPTIDKPVRKMANAKMSRKRAASKQTKIG